MAVLPRPRPLSVSWEEADNEGDTILLSPVAWRQLEVATRRSSKEPIGDVGGTDKCAVVVENSRRSDVAEGKGLRRLVCWAALDVQATENANPLGANVASSLVTSYPHIFSRPDEQPSSSTPKVHIRPTSPIPLSTVFLRAQSSSAYAVSNSQPELVLSSLAKSSQIVRQGGVISFTLEDASDGNRNGHSNGHTPDEHENDDDDEPDEPFRYTYQVLMCEPVLQGLLHPTNSTLYVVPPPSSGLDTGSEDEDETPTQSSVYRSRTPSSDGSFGEPEKPDGMEEDAPEIDSSFLANSLPPLPLPVLGAISMSASIDSLASVASRRPALEFLPMSMPWCGEGNGVLDERVHLRSSDLAKCGIFSGDWVLVSDADGNLSRLARAFSKRMPVTPSSQPSLLASPTLLHSLTSSPSSLQPPGCLTITSTPFQSLPPPLPIAQTVTVARIASPASTSKRFQPLFLRALRKHFEQGRRLVRTGDVIVVVVNAEHRGLVREGEEGELHDELLDLNFPFPTNGSKTPVFFKITNIAYEPPPSDDSVGPTNGDTYAAATLGELGCWFDPSKTRMVQSGVEHSLVPDLQLSSGQSLSPDPSTPYRKLLDLAAACLSPSAMEYDLQLCVLLRGQRGVGKFTTACQVSSRLGMHLLEVNCYDLVGESDAKTEGTLRARFENAAACSPCILVLRNIEALARNSQVLEQGKEPAIVTALRDCISDLQEAWRTSQFPVILVATSGEAEKIPLSVQACFKQEITFEAPAEAERLQILEALLEDDMVAPDVSLKDVASQSAALVAKDLVDLVSRARLGALDRATRELDEAKVCVGHVEDAGIALCGADFVAALAESRASYSESIGAPKIPNVSWDDVGGLAEVKADILDTIQLPLDHPELFADGLKKRSGILLYGPPGTGKTLLAKAVATSCSLNFFSVKGPELLNMYIGESEANVRRVFQRARDARPCVIFFDELDSVAPKRGNHGDSGGVMDRIVSQLLAELDGMSDGSSSAEVFVIGATNRPDLLDSALLRPGRFDRMLYLGVSTTHDAQLRILQALTRKFRLDPTLDLMRVAELCPFNYTGADFYALCSDSMLKAMTRKAEEIDAKIVEWNAKPPPYTHPHPMTPQYYLAELATPEDTDFLVSQRDFEAALAELVPSVTASEMEHYAAVQKRFAKDTINSEANLDRKGKGKSSEATVDRKGKGKARAIDPPGNEIFGEHVRLADAVEHA